MNDPSIFDADIEGSFARSLGLRLDAVRACFDPDETNCLQILIFGDVAPESLQAGMQHLRELGVTRAYAHLVPTDAIDLVRDELDNAGFWLALHCATEVERGVVSIGHALWRYRQLRREIDLSRRSGTLSDEQARKDGRQLDELWTAMTPDERAVAEKPAT